MAKKKRKVTKEELNEKVSLNQWEPVGMLYGNTDTKKYAALVDPDITPYGKNNLPTTMFNIQQNTIYQKKVVINQVNIKPILEQMFSNYQQTQIDELDRHFEYASSRVLLVRAFNDAESIKNALNKLVDACDTYKVTLERWLSAFNNDIKSDKYHDNGYRGTIPVALDHNIPALISTIDNNIKLIFSYIFISFLNNRSCFNKDPLVNRYLTSLENSILDVYESILGTEVQEQYWEYSVSKIRIKFDKIGLYPTLFYRKQPDLSELNKYVSYDRRYKDVLSLIETIMQTTRSKQKDDASFSIEYNKINDDSYKWKLIQELRKCLDEISHLKHLHQQLSGSELTNVEVIDPEQLLNSLTFIC
ncbi:hypothetical protein [Providencia sp. PROV145]|uniref:hypothetical protein n=1 Tax=Providencia sp. PROV145 TaxID=2949855 RepID=UPI002349BA43|nr:hypothetical protein [Providencia sp. PROV145]